jgi:head-tail adaptor
MRAGKLDRRITLRRLVVSQSASGAVVLTPQVIATVWAQKVPDRGLEAFREGQVQGWASVTWRTRYFLDGVEEPTVKWELLEGSRVYEVLEVREIGRREGWELVTRARAEDQVA